MRYTVPVMESVGKASALIQGGGGPPNDADGESQQLESFSSKLEEE